MVKVVDGFCRWVDNINERTGRIVGWLFIPFTLLVVADVFTRYVLNNPWYYLSVNVQLMGALAVLGGGYCYLHSGHASVDLLPPRLSARGRAILGVILTPFIFGTLGIFVWKSMLVAIFAIEKLQTDISPLAVPLYPYKVIIVVGILLMLFQGIVFFVRDLRVIFSAKSGGGQ